MSADYVCQILWALVYVLKIVPRQSWHICLIQHQNLCYFRCLVWKRKVDKKQAYMKTEAYKHNSRVFWIYLPNVIIIDHYNFELYHFKNRCVFSETQCMYLCVEHTGDVVDHWHLLSSYKRLKRRPRTVVQYHVRIDMSTFLNLAHDKLSYRIISIRELLKECIIKWTWCGQTVLSSTPAVFQVRQLTGDDSRLRRQQMPTAAVSDQSDNTTHKLDI